VKKDYTLLEKRGAVAKITITFASLTAFGASQFPAGANRSLNAGRLGM